MTQKLASYVADFVAKLSVRHVFSLTGGLAMHLNHAFGTHPDLECIYNLHEQASAIAADAYAKITGNLGVVVVTGGPGSTNALTGCTAAWLDSTPVLFISGQVKRADLKRDSGLRQLGVQEVDIVSMVRPITKYAVTILDPDSIRYHLEKAVTLACRPRTGPVWLDIPLDVQAAMIEPERQGRFDKHGLWPVFDAEKSLPCIMEFLAGAERPVLLVGNGVRLAGAVKDFRKVVDMLGIPVLVATSMGIDLIPDNHPLFFGRPGAIASRGANFTLQNCDLLLVVGARLDQAMAGYAHDKLARGARKVMVDVDAAELAKMRTPISITVQADAGEFLRAMLLWNKQIQDRSAWLERCRDWKNRYPVVLPEHRNLEEAVSNYYFAEVLSEELTSDDVVVGGSSGLAVELFHLVFRAKEGQRVIHSRGLGAMGFGLPAAIGSCLASNLRRTICVDGDGGFQLNIQELETVRRLGLPIKFFVINNGGYASIKLSQTNHFGKVVGADKTSGMTLPDVADVAEAYGLFTLSILGHRDMRSLIRYALDMDGPVVCEVWVDPDEVRQPRLASVVQPDGSMVSRPLEDLWPFLEREEFKANMIVPPLPD